MTNVFLISLLLIGNAAFAQINKVEHFFVTSPEADALFSLFNTKLGTPIVWDYQNWGEFESGGVSFGNVVFEFVNYKGVSKTKFEGMALEPKQSIEVFIKLLDSLHIQHDTIESNTYVSKDGSVGGWSNLNLRNLLPDEAGLFICDYKRRKEVYENRKASSDSLKSSNGGPVGIIYLKEIVIGATNYLLHKGELLKLPGISEGPNDLFNFKEGPAIRLKRSEANGIEKIVLKVHSLNTAKQYLTSKSLLGKSSANSIYINERAIDGLQIELIDE